MNGYTLNDQEGRKGETRMVQERMDIPWMMRRKGKEGQVWCRSEWIYCGCSGGKGRRDKDGAGVNEYTVVTQKEWKER